jgi:hypothetical protein
MSMKTRNEFYARPWSGANRHYDIVKEGAIALVVVTVMVFALSAVFSSPDDPALTFKGWAGDSPDSLYVTTVSQLAGSSESAGYGPPYNSNSEGLSVGPLFLQKWGGVTHPIDAAQDFVITPLSSQVEPNDVTDALKAWTAADPDQQAAWAGAYDEAIAATADENDETHLDAVEKGDYGPVPKLAEGLVAMAASGAYDNAMTGQGAFFQTDQTAQLLMMGDGPYMEDKAVAAHLGGDQWGMMNEAGSWPGQMWLAFASLWYQPPAFNTDGTTLTDNADAIIFFILLLLCAILVLVPFIPGLRSLPRWIPLHRLVWKDYYKKYGRFTP